MPTNRKRALRGGGEEEPAGSDAAHEGSSVSEENSEEESGEDGSNDEEEGSNDDGESDEPVAPEPRVLPSRTTRGKRVSALVGEAAEADAQFWGQRAFEETLSDEEFSSFSSGAGPRCRLAVGPLTVRVCGCCLWCVHAAPSPQTPATPPTRTLTCRSRRTSPPRARAQPLPPPQKRLTRTRYVRACVWGRG